MTDDKKQKYANFTHSGTNYTLITGGTDDTKNYVQIIEDDSIDSKDICPIS